MFENIKLKASEVYGILSNRDLLLWQKYDCLMSRETQYNVLAALAISVPVFWLLSLPLLGLLPITILLANCLYFATNVGGCEGSVGDAPLIVLLSVFVFGIKISMVAVVISCIAVIGYVLCVANNKR